MLIRKSVLHAAASNALKEAKAQNYYDPEWGIDGGNLIAFGTKLGDDGDTVQLRVIVPLNGLSVVDEVTAR